MLSVLKVRELKLTYGRPVPTNPVLSNSDQVADIVRKISGNDPRENAFVFFLDSQNRINGHMKLSTGIGSLSLVDPKLVFAPALLYNASGIIFAHTHPSGELKYSPSDKELTLRLKSCGDLLGVRVLDSVIVGPTGGKFSFFDNHLMD